MSLASTIVLLAMAAWIVAKMLGDAMNTDRDVLTMRNFFLFGFILFQLTSTVYTLQTGQMDYVKIVYLDEPGAVFTIMALLFLMLFLFFYGKGYVALRLAERPTWPHAATNGGLFAIAIACIGIGLVMRYLLTQVPILGILTAQMSVGALSAACGLAAWAWARNPRNAGLFLGALAVILGCSGVLLSEAWSRREITTLVFAVLWAAYWSAWRYGMRAQLITRGLLFGGAGFLLVLFLSASRTTATERFSLGEYLQKFALVTPDRLFEAGIGMANGQFAGANSLWIIENYPNNFPYTPAHSLVYFVTMPVPRAMWAGKPDPLGTRMIKEAGVTKVAAEFSFGPGIIGHIAADVPYLALPLYAFLIGGALRFLDERCRTWFNDPFIIVPLGCAATQVLAFSRGELGLFAFQATTSILGAWVAIKLCARWFWHDDSATYMAEEEDGSGDEEEGEAMVEEAADAAHPGAPGA